MNLGSSTSAHHTGSLGSQSADHFQSLLLNLESLCFRSHKLLLSFELLRGRLSSCLGRLLLLFNNILWLVEWVDEPVWQVNLASLFRFFLSNFLALCVVVAFDWGNVEDPDAFFLSHSLCLDLLLKDFVCKGNEVRHLVLQIPVEVEHLVATSPMRVFVDVCLGQVFAGDDLLDISVLKNFKFFGSTDSTAEREDSSFTRVLARGRVCDSERAVDAVAVLSGRVHCPIVFVVARVAHVVGTEATEEGHGATVLALPVNLVGTVFRASCRSSSNLFEKAVLAE